MLFSEMACFSPWVLPSIRKSWVKNGGTLTHSKEDFHRARFFFCRGLDDPWLSELLSRSLVVRHANWVPLCVSEQFLMPIAAYTLDDGFDLSRITPMISLEDSQHLAGRRTPAYDMTDTAAKSRDLATEDEHPKFYNPRKRAFATEDQSLPDIITRPPKKPRIQNTSVDSDQTFVHLVAATTNQEKQDDQEQNYFNLATQPIMSPVSSSVIKTSRTPPKKVLRFAPDWSLPALKPKKPRQPQALKIMTRQPEQNIKSDPDKSKLASPDRPPTKPITKTTTRLESAHTMFWTNTREAYAGSGPVTVNISDILQAKGLTIQAAIFTSKGSYQEKNFACHGLLRLKP